MEFRAPPPPDASQPDRPPPLSLHSPTHSESGPAESHLLADRYTRVPARNSTVSAVSGYLTDSHAPIPVQCARCAVQITTRTHKPTLVDTQTQLCVPDKSRVSLPRIPARNSMPASWISHRLKLADTSPAHGESCNSPPRRLAPDRLYLWGYSLSAASLACDNSSTHHPARGARQETHANLTIGSHKDSSQSR